MTTEPDNEMVRWWASTGTWRNGTQGPRKTTTAFQSAL